MLRWLPPADADLAGYILYARSAESTAFGAGVDLGFVPADPTTGEADVRHRAPARRPGRARRRASAYDEANQESEGSNEVQVSVAAPPECVIDADCADGDTCNGAESCVAGSCVAGDALSCPATDQCNAGYCDSEFGCATTPLENGTPCDDGIPRPWWTRARRACVAESSV